MSDKEMALYIVSWAVFALPWSFGGSLGLADREDFSRFVEREAVAQGVLPGVGPTMSSSNSSGNSSNSGSNSATVRFF